MNDDNNKEPLTLFSLLDKIDAMQWRYSLESYVYYNKFDGTFRTERCIQVIIYPPIPKGDHWSNERWEVHFFADGSWSWQVYEEPSLRWLPLGVEPFFKLLGLEYSPESEGHTDTEIDLSDPFRDE